MFKKFAAAIIVCVILFQNVVVVAFAAEESSSSQNTIQYELSYPGLLPDHPFYILKQVRDNMMTLLIGEPIDRSAFMLLQSDKQVSAAIIMIDRKKDLKMVKDSFAASQKSFEDAIEGTQAAKQEGLATGDMIRKLRIASKKHNEIIREILVQFSPEDKKLFTDVEKKSYDLIPLTALLKIK